MQLEERIARLERENRIHRAIWCVLAIPLLFAGCDWQRMEIHESSLGTFMVHKTSGKVYVYRETAFIELPIIESKSLKPKWYELSDIGHRGLSAVVILRQSEGKLIAQLRFPRPTDENEKNQDLEKGTGESTDANIPHRPKALSDWNALFKTGKASGAFELAKLVLNDEYDFHLKEIPIDLQRHMEIASKEGGIAGFRIDLETELPESVYSQIDGVSLPWTEDG